MKKILNCLKASGAKNAEAAFDELIIAGWVSDFATPANVAQLLVAMTASDTDHILGYTVTRLAAETEDGVTFGQALRESLSHPVCEVSQITICQNRPWATISLLSGETIEFEINDGTFTPVRTDYVISGALFMKLASTGYTVGKLKNER